VRPADKVIKMDTDKSGKSKKPELLEVVFVVEEDTVRAVPLKLGINSEDYFEIPSGLDTTYTIVTGNHQALTFDLQNGTAVIDESKAKKKDRK
jgi:hypothetical protein